MCDHGHHGHDGCGGHDEVPLDTQFSYNLHQKVDIASVECLNEQIEGSCQKIFKSWSDRTAKDHCVESDADEELLFKVPFTGSVKIQGILLVGGEDDSHPKTMRLYKNRPMMTFEEAGGEADQEIELARDENGTVDYPLKPAKFSSVSHLCIHLSANFGADSTKVYYIGLRGQFMEAHREEIVITNYEIRPNPADHVKTLSDHTNHIIS